MRIAGFILLACTTLIRGVIRPSFWLSRCAWEATDVVELAVAPGTAGFRVVATIKGAIRPGAIKMLPELMAPVGDHSLLKDLTFDYPGFRSHEIAPPIRDVDRVIVFLRPGDKPAHLNDAHLRDLAARGRRVRLSTNDESGADPSRHIR
jgi:hypothetical protein